MSLDGQEPIVPVGFAAGLDGDETVAALDAVEPEDVVKAFLLSEACGEKASGVVAGGFAVTGPAGEGSDETLFGEKSNRLREIGADGRGHDDEAETIGGADEEGVVDTKVRWADVERTALTMRDPIAIEPNQFGDPF